MDATRQYQHRAVALVATWVSVPVLALVMAWLWGIFETCENRLLSKIVAPDQSHYAAVFERKCSETETWVTHVAVLLSGNNLTDQQTGNVYVGSERHGPLQVLEPRTAEVSVIWTTPSRLVLSNRDGIPGQLTVARIDTVEIVQEQLR